MPNRLPAATAEIRNPNVDGELNCLFARKAIPTLIGPVIQKFNTEATSNKERNATSSFT